MDLLKIKIVTLMWHGDEVDRLHVKRNSIVGMNYLGIIDMELVNMGVCTLLILLIIPKV